MFSPAERYATAALCIMLKTFWLPQLRIVCEKYWRVIMSEDRPLTGKGHPL
jgi:hypothetical protein